MCVTLLTSWQHVLCLSGCSSSTRCSAVCYSFQPIKAFPTLGNYCHSLMERLSSRWADSYTRPGVNPNSVGSVILRPCHVTLLVNGTSLTEDGELCHKRRVRVNTKTAQSLHRKPIAVAYLNLRAVCVRGEVKCCYHKSTEKAQSHCHSQSWYGWAISRSLEQQRRE